MNIWLAEKGAAFQWAKPLVLLSLLTVFSTVWLLQLFKSIQNAGSALSMATGWWTFRHGLTGTLVNMALLGGHPSVCTSNDMLWAFAWEPQSYFWLSMATDAFCTSKEQEQAMQAMSIRCRSEYWRCWADCWKENVVSWTLASTNFMVSSELPVTLWFITGS